MGVDNLQYKSKNNLCFEIDLVRGLNFHFKSIFFNSI